MPPGPIEFRVFHPNDLPEIARIQDANCVSNLSREQREDGFLSVVFSASQFVAMHREIPMVVADCGHNLGGYMCGCTLASGAGVPLLGRMISLFPRTLYKGRPLDQYPAFIYGPVCVDRAYRGKGVIEGLFGAFLAQLAGRYDVGALFVSLENPRSLNAHIHKLGMRKLCHFSFSGKEYGLLVFEVPG